MQHFHFFANCSIFKSFFGEVCSRKIREQTKNLKIGKMFSPPKMVVRCKLWFYINRISIIRINSILFFSFVCCACIVFFFKSMYRHIHTFDRFFIMYKCTYITWSETFNRSVRRSDGRSVVCYNDLKGRNVSLSCFYRSTCLYSSRVKIDFSLSIQN